MGKGIRTAKRARELIMKSPVDDGGGSKERKQSSRTEPRNAGDSMYGSKQSDGQESTLHMPAFASEINRN